MAAHPPVDPHAVEAAHGAADTAAHGASGGFPPFDALTFGTQLFWFAVTFVLLYLVVSRFVLPTVGGVLAKRAGTIAGDLDQAAQKSAAAEEARVSMERAIAKARADARSMIEAARTDVMAKLNAEQEAAEKRLTDRIATAEASVDAARKKALAEVPAIADQLARDIADKIAPVSTPARQRVAGEA
ncbi:F0F1 ATP synthase subunit B family protein [Terricaulis silvestris]|uniref:ATP synthase subunit b n=1 Tax=Terricaulis silvestris TaxID=2686094 RepID=A0A6I6MSM5_9CAUL|nr:F0F1 ATP synthase subunit B' [Terricaulis silvestris]QGZ95787.1 F-type ATPase subunit b 2 [Terricaulis silvestris]